MNIMRFDKVIAKIIRVQFFCLTVYILLTNFISHDDDDQ